MVSRTVAAWTSVKHPRFERMSAHTNGSRYQTVGDYWWDVQDKVDIVDLAEITDLDLGLDE